MNKYKLNLLFTILFLSGNSLFAQIGINTDNPLTLFHIHTRSDNGAEALNVSDDVMFSSDGNMGIGMLPDNTAKLQIDSDEGSVRTIKLQDGNEGLGKILSVLNTSGDVGWIKAPTSWALISYLTTPMTIPNAVWYVLYQSPPVPQTGNYLITIRWIGHANSKGAAKGAVLSSYFYLYSSTSSTYIDGIEYYVPYWVQNSKYAFSVSLMGQLNVGENIIVKMIPSTVTGSYSWLTGVDGTDIKLNPSVLIFKL